MIDCLDSHIDSAALTNECEDIYDVCACIAWAAQGDCEEGTDYECWMAFFCKKSCGKCWTEYNTTSTTVATTVTSSSYVMKTSNVSFIPSSCGMRKRKITLCLLFNTY